MAAGALIPPGIEHGPCQDERCGHTDCAGARSLATAQCPICGEEIGYSVRFYFHTYEVELSHGGTGEMYTERRTRPAHAFCVESKVSV